MTDPPAKTTWTEESFDDVEVTPDASAGTHSVCRNIWELTCVGPNRRTCFSAVRLGARNAAIGYLKQKLAAMAQCLDPAVCQTKPTAVLQNWDVSVCQACYIQLFCFCMSSQEGVPGAGPSAAG